jgi:hypothetical protein
VVLIDNLQMHHTGMPGFGPRALRVLLCNPLPLRFPADSGVADLSGSDPRHISIDEYLRSPS